ncbi:MAG: alpha/beta hydrolase-fold protein, partial [Solirubrobacteraceae bacterium]
RPHISGGSGSSGSSGGVAAGLPARTQSIRCPSPALGGSLPAEVYLPAGYAPGRRYPVIYFLHGLPAGPTSYQGYGFVASALAGSGPQAIVVAAQGARQNNSDREYLDWDAQENWPLAIAQDLPHCIDSRYSTIPGRYGRALIGLSAGGYGAFNIGLRNLGQFAAIESWSGYFVATDPAGDQVLDLGSTAANSAALVPRGPALRSALAARPSLVAFYVGIQDARFLTMNRQYDASLRQSGITHTFSVYPGGHSATLWGAQARSWLGMALGYLAAGRRHPAHS